MGRKPIGKRAMTDAERQQRRRALARAEKLRRETAKLDAVAKQVIAMALADGDLDDVSPGTRECSIATAEAVLAGLRAAGLSIVRTSSLR